MWKLEMQCTLAVFEQGAARREWLALFEGCNEAQALQACARRVTADKKRLWQLF